MNPPLATTSVFPTQVSPPVVLGPAPQPSITDELLNDKWDAMIERVCRQISSGVLTDVAARSISQTITSCSGVIASVFLRYDADGSLVGSMPLVCRREFNSLAPGWQETIRGVVQSMQQDRMPRILRLPQQSAQLAILAMPVTTELGVPYAICVVVPAEAKTIALFQTVIGKLVQRIASEMGAQHQTVTDAPTIGHSAATPLSPVTRSTFNECAESTDTASVRDAAVWLTSLLQAMEGTSLEHSLQPLAATLNGQLGSFKVFLGIRQGYRQQCRLLAISGEPQCDRRTSLALECEEVFAEAIARREAIVVADDDRSHHLTSAARSLMRTCAATTLASGPLLCGTSAPFGGWIAVGNKATPSVAQTVTSSPMLSAENRLDIDRAAGCINMVLRGQPGWKESLQRTLWSPDRRQRHRTLAVIGSVLCASLLVPLPYHVKSACEVQPVTRRFVPVPYQGVLKDVTVAPGDVVRVGQVLARMDDREIDWELAAKQAEYERAKKQHDISLASALTAEAQIAKLEMERIDVQIHLLRDRIKNLEITSPIDGVIISGDPSKREGARLAQGDALFEVGPLDRMLVELYIPDCEVSHVRLGQPASVRLDAFPARQFTGDLVRVSPSAMPRDQSNVFVAEIELESPKHLLRPGMSGHGRVRTMRHTLGWILFHKPWRALFQRLD